MDKELKNRTVRKFLLGSAVVLLCVFGLLFWAGYVRKVPAPATGLAGPVLKQPASPKIVLRSSIAGTWYPADANALNKQIEGLFQKAQVKPINDVIALILPHAGYQYSGQTAAMAIKSVAKEYKRIVIIGPSHRVPMEDILSVPRATHYQTPLGEVELDVEFINKLLRYPLFQNVPDAQEYEHSVQIQVPLLQHRLKGFKLVPIVAGNCSQDAIIRAGNILKSLVDEGTLVVASSDFTHYGPNYGYVPFKENVPEQIKKLDMGAYEYIAKLDGKGFLEYRAKTGATICGYVPIAILLSMFSQGVKAELVNYATSGELMGDFTNSVSYLGVVFCGAWQKTSANEPQANRQELTSEDKKKLLVLARKSILYAIANRRVPEASELGVTVSDAMSVPRAAFVTLKKNAQLRGCIGDVLPQRPLFKSVILNAINAAFNDRRFPPVVAAECNDIKIEISALTVPSPIESPAKIRIGIDGVVLNKDGRSALFLPQVAPEQGWDVNEMLANLSLKAGL
ncbi:MAG: AmmeMemoRadiSam system protein B, partial [Planctomycetota bacterium]|nr:AmmeMemoRadiSam system protein B [Planctomycetota bacterium]